MATWDDVRRPAPALPEAAEETSRELLRWTVRGKHVVWERRLRKADIEALGEAATGAEAPGPGVRRLGVLSMEVANMGDTFG